MALNNDQSDGIIDDQRKRGRQRASCAPQGVVPEHITWAAEEYEPLFEAVAKEREVREMVDQTEVNRTHYITYADYMRAMHLEAEDVVTEALSDMSDNSHNRHQRRAEAAENRRMNKYSVRLGGTHGTHRT